MVRWGKGGEGPDGWGWFVENRPAAVRVEGGGPAGAGLAGRGVGVWVRGAVFFSVEVHHELGGGEWAVVVCDLGIRFVKAKTCLEGEVEILSRWGAECCLLGSCFRILVAGVWISLKPSVLLFDG